MTALQHHRPTVHAFFLVSLLLFAGCAGTMGGGSASPPALAYRLPATTEATYIIEAETMQGIEMMGQTMGGEGNVTMTVDASFGETPGGIRATLRVVEASAEMDMMGENMFADEDDIDGEWVFLLDRMGNAAVEALPEAGGDGEDLFEFLSMSYALFPGLPGTGVAVGDTWADTVSFSGDQGGGTIESTTISEYTFVGDTVAGGTSLMRVNFTGDNDLLISTEQEGVAIGVSGEMDYSGYFLWDPAAALLVALVHEGEGLGSLDIAMLPEVVPVAMSGTYRMTLNR